jgi:hypothetical protein
MALYFSLSKKNKFYNLFYFVNLLKMQLTPVQFFAFFEQFLVYTGNYSILKEK